MWQISLQQKIIFQICFIAPTAVAGFRAVVLKSKDGGEERNEQEEQSDEDGVLLSEVTIIEVIIEVFIIEQEEQSDEDGVILSEVSQGWE